MLRNDYSTAVKHLFNTQMAEWELMSSNYEAVKNIKTKSFRFDEFTIKVQLNRQRIKSTSAEVDVETIKSRKCFLCLENLPAEQKGILIENNYLILSNPYPIFPEHFTISLAQHKPQRILNNFNKFLSVTKHLSRDYTLIYNGPGCGASAPDHLHFQSGTRLIMPVEDDIHLLQNKFGEVVLEQDEITVTAIADGTRTIILLESNDGNLLENAFKKIFSVYKEFSKSSAEPLLNILSNYHEKFGWSVIVFLRNKHRPACYYGEGKKKILVSPAAVDLGGLLITPREEDFERMNEEIIKKIFSEVSLNKENFSELRKKLKHKLNK